MRTPKQYLIDKLGKQANIFSDTGFDLIAEIMQNYANELQTKTNNKMSNFIPYQLCPKCNGDGKIPNIMGTSAFITCNLCNGAMVIPMYVSEVITTGNSEPFKIEIKKSDLNQQ